MASSANTFTSMKPIFKEVYAKGKNSSKNKDNYKYHKERFKKIENLFKNRRGK